MDEDVGWIRPATGLESFINAGQQRGTSAITYRLTLNSKVPIREALVKQALQHLYRKIPILRVCLISRNDSLWLREMKQEKIDLKVHAMNKLEETHKEVNNKVYNSLEGPLWCAHFFTTDTQDTDNDPKDTNIQDDMDNKSYINIDETAGFIFKYAFIFGWAHTITDGTTNILICKHFLHLMNSLIEGDRIDDNIQLAEMADNKETNKLSELKRKELNGNQDDLENKLNFLSSFSKEPCLFLKAYPPLTGKDPDTFYLFYDLGREHTRLFIDRCKIEGVSVHSAFCGIINAAIVEMMQESMIDSKSFNINARHAVNIRTFWETQNTGDLGCHMEDMFFAINTPKNVRSNLWTYVKEYHQSFHNKLKTGGVFETGVLDEMNFISSGINPANIFDTPMTPYAFYQTSNMGVIDKKFTGLGRYVEVTDIVRTASLHHWNLIVDHFLHTFRGHLKYTMLYDATRMKKETAKYYMGHIFNILKQSLV